MDSKFLSIFFGLIFTLGLFSAPVAYAIPASEGPGPSTTDTFEDTGGPYTISKTIKFDPDAGPWIKELDVGEAFTRKIIETITVDPTSPPISDWHQLIINPSPTAPAAVWVDCPGAAPIPPFVVTPAGSFPGMIGTSPGGAPGDSVWFDFPPVLPGESFTIEKCFLPTSPSTITIHQWPTIKDGNGRMAVGGEFIPIDATAVLIAGAQSNALTILSAFVVIGAIAFGTLYFSVKRKRN